MGPGMGWSPMAVPSPCQCIQGHLELQIPNLLHPIPTCSQCYMFTPSLNHSQPHGKCHSQSPLPSPASVSNPAIFVPSITITLCRHLGVGIHNTDFVQCNHGCSSEGLLRSHLSGSGLGPGPHRTLLVGVHTIENLQSLSPVYLLELKLLLPGRLAISWFDV